LKQTVVGEVLAGVLVRDIMTQRPATVSPDITVQQAVSDYFLVHPHTAYPVVRDGAILGILTLQSVRAVPIDQRATVVVLQAMIPKERAVTVEPTMTALDAMQKMAPGNAGTALVVENGELLGVLTRGDVMRAIQTREVLAS
jgi:predicted transcriptional regulator